MNADRPRKRVRINRPYPTHTLEDVLPIARAIQDANSGLPMGRELLASALGTTPSSSGFRMKLTSSAKYNLTLGGYSDEDISLTPLGQQCVAPQNQDEARASLVKAASAPEIFRDFYRLLNGKRMPEELYAKNMLIRELNVHPDLASECFATIIANGLFSGILRTDGQDLKVVFADGLTVEHAAITAQPEPPRTRVSETTRREALTVGATDGSRPSIFVGYFEPSETVDRIVDILDGLELTIVQGDVRSAESQSLALSADITRVMQNCVAGIVIAPDTTSGSGSGADAPHDARERAIWLFLGAATFQYGEKVVLVETSIGTSSRTAPGIRTVAAHPENLEAAALGILTALIEVGAIKLVA